MDVVRSLEDLLHTLDAFDEKQQKALAKELAYLTEHKDRTDYKQARKQG